VVEEEYQFSLPFRRSMEAVPSAIGTIAAATVVCLRRSASRGFRRVAVVDLPLFGKLKEKFFHDREELLINQSWDVLMGQRPVVNFPKSSKDKVKIMNYPGEFVLPGGRKDEGETLKECALREFEEEVIGGSLDDRKSVNLKHFFTFTTKVVRKRRHKIHSFVALETENPWVGKIDVKKLNERSERCLETERRLLENGSYWDLSYDERQAVGCELRRLSWIPLEDAILMTMASIPESDQSLVPVNDFQRNEFLKYGIKKRDPMMATMFALLHVAMCKDENEILNNSPGESSHTDKMERFEKFKQSRTQGRSDPASESRLSRKSGVGEEGKTESTIPPVSSML